MKGFSLTMFTTLYSADFYAFHQLEPSTYAHGDGGGVCRSVTLSVCFKRSFGVCFTSSWRGPPTAPRSVTPRPPRSIIELLGFRRIPRWVLRNKLTGLLISVWITTPDVLLLMSGPVCGFSACVYMDTQWPRQVKHTFMVEPISQYCLHSSL